MKKFNPIIRNFFKDFSRFEIKKKAEQKFAFSIKKSKFNNGKWGIKFFVCFKNINKKNH
jgi:hypothetical protein